MQDSLEISNLALLWRFGLEHSNAPQGPEEMCLSLEHQNPSKTSDRVIVSLHILYTANQETEGSQDRLTV